MVCCSFHFYSLFFQLSTWTWLSHFSASGNWQKEIKDLKDRLEIASSSAANSAKKLREGYIQKLDVLGDQVIRDFFWSHLDKHVINCYDVKFFQVTELKKKLDAQSQLSIRRQKGEGATKQTDLEITSLKAQKVVFYCVLYYYCLHEALPLPFPVSVH